MVKPTSDNPSLNEDQGESSEPKYATNEQLNAAITARFRAFEAKQSEQMARLEALLATKAEPQEEAKPSKRIAEDPLVLALKAQVETLQKDKQKARESNLRARVQEELIASGVNPKMVKALASLHIDGEKSISYAGDTDELIFSQGDSVYGIKDGIQAWLHSGDNKVYLAPKGASGSGATDVKNAPKLNSNQKLSESEAGEALKGFFFGE